MPLLAFAKERLDPDLALAHCLLIGRGLLVGPHTLLHRRMKGAMDDAALRPWRTGRFHWTGIAGGGVGPVLGLLGLVLPATRPQELPLRTPIEVPFGVVGEVGWAKVVGMPIPLSKQRHVGTDAHVVQGADVLQRAVF